MRLCFEPPPGTGKGQADTMEQAKLTQLSFDDAVERWLNLSRQISALKEQELALRNQIFTAGFPKPKEGLNSITLQNGARLKATYPINRSVDDQLWRPIRATLIAKGYHADDIVRYKPSLADGPYKKLPPDIRRMVDKAITAKPGTPSLKVE